MTERSERSNGNPEALSRDNGQRYLNSALRLNSDLELNLALGLYENRDVISMLFSIAIRFARNDIYNAKYVRRTPIRSLKFNSLIARLSSGLEEKIESGEEALVSLNDDYQEYVKEQYDDNLHRPRTIDLAVNDLIARSTVQNGQFVSVKPNMKILVPWRERWRESLIANTQTE